MPRPDFSEYVAHFTKNAPPFGLKENAEDGSIKAVKGNATERLVSILTSKKIFATPMPWTNRPAVAFTECPWGSLLDHTKQYSPYGVGFTKAHLFAAGGGPAIYFAHTCMRTRRIFGQRARRNGGDSIQNYMLSLLRFALLMPLSSTKRSIGKRSR